MEAARELVTMGEWELRCARVATARPPDLFGSVSRTARMLAARTRPAGGPLSDAQSRKRSGFPRLAAPPPAPTHCGGAER